jgi:hypothetical protein
MASTDCHPDGVTPRVFLSYSHDSEVHRAWVRLLAERLLEGGVEVTLDQWDLRPGGYVVRFMDQGIRDADRVLMVCTANYVAKAEERKGGAGYEGMIVTGHVARATDTIKFVPIVRDHTGESLVPAFRLRVKGNLLSKRWTFDHQDVRVDACDVDLGEGESLRLIQIPTGDFLMGSPATETNGEEPQHRVKLATFLIGQTPVTRAQWAVVARWAKGERSAA